MIGRVDENNREWKSERKGRKESIELRGRENYGNV